ncbi:hypothetical protein [Alsobacter sp. R-9]
MTIRRRTFADLIRRVLSRIGFDGYDPARHYMRGPGPRTRAKQALRDKDEPASTSAKAGTVKEQRG